MIKKSLYENTYYKYINGNSNGDFYVLIIGYEKCAKTKKVQGPMIKNHYLIHYVLSGKGVFYLNGTKYNIKANDIFFIPPDATMEYVQDMKDSPWEYIWIEYNGANANSISEKALFTAKSPVYSNRDSSLPTLLTEMINVTDGIAENLIAESYVLRFFAKIIEARNYATEPTIGTGQEFLRSVFKYIEDNYGTENLGLDTISRHFNLSPCYFSRYFKKLSGQNLSNYITDYRVQKACELLRSRPDLSVGNIARSVGFSDPLYFSKIFRKNINNSPSGYAKNYSSEDYVEKNASESK